MRLYVLGFALGVWWLQQQAQLPPVHAYWLALPIVFAAFAAMPIYSLPWHYVRRIAAIACCIGCGVAWAAWLAQSRLADELPVAWEGESIEVVGVVSAMPQAYERSVRFEFDVEHVLTPGADVPTHIAVSWWGTPERGAQRATLPALRAGERWQLTLRLRRPHGTLNPHGFDYESWLLERNIRATGYVRAGPDNRRITTFVSRPQYWIERMREAVRARIEMALTDSPYAGVLTALAVGDQRAISQAQWQVFTRTGVNHLMSISGLHVTMLSGLAFASVFALWRRSARLTLRLPALKAATIAGLLTAVAYAWLAGFAVPSQRTVYMLAVVAIALWSGRVSSASVVLCAALFVVLLVDPWAVLAPGFWLSFGAVALIMFVTTARIAQEHWFLAWARVQWAITLGLIPLLLALFQQISLVSPVANAIAIPVVSFVVVPLTLLGVVLPFDGVLHLAHAVMSACGTMLEWMSALPLAVWQQHAPVPWTVVAAMLAIVWMLLPRGFPARWIGVAGLLPMFLIEPAALAEGSLKLTVLDVGQGLAVVAQTRSHALLYDAGPSYGPQLDSGNRTIVPFLRASGVRTLSGMVITHADNDHSGGANSVLQAMSPQWLLTSMAAGHPSIAQAAAATRCEAGNRWQWDGVDFELLHPARENYAREKFRGNDRSCVLKITAAGRSILLAADIEQKSEREMLASAGDKLRAQILLVPHHGSRTSSSADFVSRVNPDIALVAAGFRNRFGHPKDDVLERYRMLGTRIYRTDLDGALLIEMGGDAINVQRYRALYRRYWHSALENPDLPDDDIE
ncbi:MAG: internalization-related competence protein ComEC/Rec2 [Betaproteobacteria bacterium]|nr:internalization-related competence protein ComEC/Rec2 [Betaproteobacteria bacterium]